MFPLSETSQADVSSLNCGPVAAGISTDKGNKAMLKTISIPVVLTVLTSLAIFTAQQSLATEPEFSGDPQDAPFSPFQWPAAAADPPARDYLQQLLLEKAAADAQRRARETARGVAPFPVMPAPFPPNVDAPAPSSNGPSRFTHEAGRFSIVLPQRPKCWTERKDPTSPEVTQTFLMIDRTEYDIAYRDFAAGDMAILRSNPAAFDRLFQDWLDGAMNNLHARLHHRARRTIVGRGAWEFELVMQDGRGFIGWFFLVDNRLYQVNIAGPGLSADHPDVQQFLDSFQLCDRRQ